MPVTIASAWLAIRTSQRRKVLSETYRNFAIGAFGLAAASMSAKIAKHDPEKIIVPAGIQGQLVIRERICALLRLGPSGGKIKPKVPTPDGLNVVDYTGPNINEITIFGELNKLAHNISFGHGIHAGIHWRSDTDYSILLGEDVALQFLRDQASTYTEEFSIDIYKFDGTKETISNPLVRAREAAAIA